MMPQEGRDDGGRLGGRWRSDKPVQFVLAVAAIVLVALSGLGALAPLHALAGLVAIAGAALLGLTMVRRESAAQPVADAPAPSTAPSADLLIAGIPDPVIVLDRHGIVVAFNPAALRVAPALHRGEPVSLALRMPAVVEAVRRAGTNGEAQRAEFSERVPLDRSFEMHVVPVPVARGAAERPALLLLTLHDLTPLRRIEEMRADFVANASHELRTPLASLSGFIDTLQGPARDDAVARARFLDIMKAQAQRMARLIDDLLSLSRIELKAHVQPETRVELAPIVRQVVDGLQMLARERTVEVVVTGSADRLEVRGDRDELVRVFENLIENALKYGAGGKRVDIRLARDEASDARPAEAIVCVQDYGQGIAAEHLSRLTERFYRVDVGQSRAEGGTGLGLALVKHILNRHRGRLTIASTVGAGATFRVHLPLAHGVAENA